MHGLERLWICRTVPLRRHSNLQSESGKGPRDYHQSIMIENFRRLLGRIPTTAEC